MKRFILISATICCSLLAKAQYYGDYVVIDPDGYTNVREQPNVSSKILGTIDKYQIFARPENSCYYDRAVEIIIYRDRMGHCSASLPRLDEVKQNRN